MKYYKVINPAGHYGLIYKEGLNVDPKPFNPTGSCQPGGIYFAREDILTFLNYGTEIYEVDPVGEIYEENAFPPHKFKAHAVNLKYVGKTVDVNVIKILVEAGADIYVDNDFPLRWAARMGHIEIVKLLFNKGIDIHIDNDYALCYAASEGHTDIVKFLIDNGADVHAERETALRTFSGRTW